MSIKDLFNKNYVNKVVSSKSLEELGLDAGSPSNITTGRKKANEFVPPIDFQTGSNFAVYGSAAKYYYDGIRRIYLEYPYDGSKSEINEFVLSSSYVDKYILEEKYPRSTGYVLLCADGWGSPVATLRAASGFYGAPATGSYEYISLTGGPHTERVASEAFATSFTGSHNPDNIYDPATNRGSNLELNPISGSTVEFWLKKAAFNISNTQKEVIFDIWNGKESTSDGAYGRFTLEMSASGPGDAGQNVFLLTYLSGTTGITRQSIGSTSITTSSVADDEWSHYAVSVVSSSNDGLVGRLYLNGELDDTKSFTGIGELSSVSGALEAQIGALRTTPPGLDTYPTRGWGKLSASLDEFRYWKAHRTAQDIGRNWWSQVYGGTNTSDANTSLGVYYKFNEGITGTGSLDSTVLDYSGRISNGSWTGYASNSRNTGSAIVSASAAAFEFEDPIIYATHPRVESLQKSLVASGSTYDDNNNSQLFKSLPAWIIESDTTGDLSNFTQILASYLDKLQTQIREVPRLKNVQYLSSSAKALPFSSHLVESKGLLATDIFVDANVLEAILSRDEDRDYRLEFDQIKNTIYQNIYNNLVHIYKSKGTEKSFRNLVHCYGVGEDLIRLNTYANNITYELKDNFRSSVLSKNIVDFSNSDRFTATIYQYTASNNANSVSFISGTASDPVDNSVADYIPITLESEIVFPNILSVCCGITGSFKPSFTTSSVYGMHSADDTEPYETTWPANDYADLRVVAIKDDLNSADAKFKLTSSIAALPQLTSSYFSDVYDNNKWNFAVRIVNEKYPIGDFVSGSTTSGSSYAATPYRVEFYGVNTTLDSVKNEFYLTGTVPNTNAINLIRSAKRVFAGAHRTNFTGSDVHQESDVKVSSVRYWTNYIPNEIIQAHARDGQVYGAPSASANSFVTQNSLTGTYLPQAETLALNWSFYDVTGSNENGRFTIEDLSSGSVESQSRYMWLGKIARAQHTGRGDFFPVNNQSVVDRNYLPIARQALPERVQSSEMVRILDQDDENFTRDQRPVDYFFSIEKSLYQVISDEMINMFGTISEFNRLIGDPINRYRQDYKLMEKAKNLFFEGVDNTPDLDKFIDFYKWIDSSLSVFLMQLIPASANSSETIRTLVESHILERNKYWSKFPTLEGLNIAPEGITPGPIPVSTTTPPPTEEGVPEETERSSWWSSAASRKDPPLATGDATFDAAREDLKEAIYPPSTETPTTVLNPRGTRTGVSSTGAPRRSRWGGVETPARLSLSRGSPRRNIGGGVNYSPNKDRSLVYNATFPGGPVAASGTPLNVLLMHTFDVGGLQNVTSSGPIEQRKLFYTYQASFRREDETGVSGVNNSTFTSVMKGDLASPFNLVSSSVSSGYNRAVVTRFMTGSQITNLHSDTTTLGNHIPAQGPFTNQHVGGRQGRHIKINRYDDSLSTTNNIDDQYSRPESWQLLLGSEYGAVGQHAMGFVGPDYPAASESTYPSTRRQKAIYFRNVRAKRPVNIRNIKHTTSSVNLGNYSKDYEVVQTSGRSINNLVFVSSSGAALPALYINTLKQTTNPNSIIGIGTSIRGNYFGTNNGSLSDLFESTTNYSVEETGDKAQNQVVIANRFSSPGGPEVQSLGYLDIAAKEKSVYSALPYRNLTVLKSGSGEANTIRVQDQLDKQRGLHNLLSLHAGQFGYDPTFGSIPSLTYITQPSYHKNNRNTLKRIEFNGSLGYAQYGATTTGSVRDNALVNHSMPRSDLQYSWITASYEHARILGHAWNDSYVSSSEGVQQAIEFVSSSQISKDGNKIDFVGLNTLLINSVDIDTNTLSGSLNDSIAALNDTELLNALNLNRNGPYGVNTWTQIRGESEPVARTLRRKNLISFVRKSNFNYPIAVVSSSAVSRFGAIDKYTESPVVTKFAPIAQAMVANNITADGDIVSSPVTLESSYANNLNGFSNTVLNNKYGVSERHVQSYDTIKNLYLNDRSSSADSPVSQFDYLLYRESIYPALINAYSSSVRVRQNYRNTFWRTERGDVYTPDGRNQKSVPAFDGTGINVIRNQSMWNMDADWDFESAARNPTTRISLHSDGAPGFSATSVGGPGILQNYYAQIGDNAGGNVKLPVAPYYARRHTLTTNIRSVVGPEGLVIPETGSGYQTFSNNKKELIPFDPDSQAFGGQALWEVAQQSKRQPWYNSYEDYVSQMRVKGKEYSIIPEFRISQHVENYIKAHGGDFLADNLGIFEVSGGTEGRNDSDEENFYRTYSNSDFLKFFEIVRSDHSAIAEPSSVGLKCKGLLKFLPYNGFYPQERTFDLAHMFSSSYGNYVNLTVNGAALPTTTASYAAFGAFVHPIYAPGLLFNTIKSGIAVDYPIFTSSMDIVGGYEGTLGSTELWGTGFISGSEGMGRFGSRLPFETLIEPENYMKDIDIVNSETHLSAAQNCTASWSGDGGPLYKLMASNFFAEVPEFFLPEKQFTSLVSSPETNWQSTESGRVYAARIKVRKSYNNVTTRTGSLGYRNPLTPIDQWRTDLHETFTMYSRPTAFGPPVAGSPANWWSSVGGFNPCYTPPYYYGEAWADVFFTAPRSGSFSIDDLLSPDNLAVSYLRIGDDWLLSGTPGATFINTMMHADNIEFNTMQLDASFNLFGKAQVKRVTYDPTGSPISVEDDASDNVWVLQSKFETPMLNFADVSVTSPANGSGSVARGMWHQYGVYPDSPDKGIFFSISDIPSSYISGALGGDPSLTGSLVDLVGMPSDERRLGETATSKTVREAIVAVPYIEVGSQREFFNIDTSEIESALSGALGEENSIQHMVNAMQRYVIPPRLDFLKNPDRVDPFAMYIFEFEHTFDREDLTNIWQGVLPKIGYAFDDESDVFKEGLGSPSNQIEKEVVISHPLLAGQLLSSESFDNNIRWMVFKVKEQANKNYFSKVIKDQLNPNNNFDKGRAAQIGREDSTRVSEPKYSYNWPYDFFSLVELVNIEAEVEISGFDEDS